MSCTHTHTHKDFTPCALISPLPAGSRFGTGFSSRSRRVSQSSGTRRVVRESETASGMLPLQCLMHPSTLLHHQWFTADVMRGHGVQRIQDASTLRAAQFLEDCGPTAHPIRPESYIAMDNFYTSTVYLKGAEVVRMLHTMLGEAGFKAGMRLYVSRHDGQAATCEDFLAAMRGRCADERLKRVMTETTSAVITKRHMSWRNVPLVSDANPSVTSLHHFGRWYKQAGTPLVTLKEAALDHSQQTYTVTFSQSNQGQGGQAQPPLPIPLRTSLFDRDTGALLQSQLLVLSEEEQSFTLRGVSAAAVVVSPLQGFSAPVHMHAPQRCEQDMLFLLQHDPDPFTRWDCQQHLTSSAMVAVAAEGSVDAVDSAEVSEEFIRGFKKTLLAVKVRLCVWVCQQVIIVFVLSSVPTSHAGLPPA